MNVHSFVNFFNKKLLKLLTSLIFNKLYSVNFPALLASVDHLYFQNIKSFTFFGKVNPDLFF
jgi:hypothetical protein